MEDMSEEAQFLTRASIATLNEAGEIQMEDGQEGTVTEIIFINVSESLGVESEVILVEEETEPELPPPKRQRKTAPRKRTPRKTKKQLQKEEEQRQLLQQQQQLTTTIVAVDGTQEVVITTGVDDENEKEPTCSYAVLTLFLRCTEETCSMTFANKAERVAHLRLVHRVAPYPCPLSRCLLRFESSAQLSSHVRENHRHVLSWQCPKCPNEFKRYKLLYMHMWIMHDEGHFQCPHTPCQFEATYRKQVYNHIDHRHQVQKFVCPFEGCIKAFTTRNELKAHERRIHLLLKPYRCKWPGCTYSSEVCPAVIRHIRTQHFHLPETMRKQREKNIVDFRDPKEYLDVICDPNKVYAVLTPANTAEESRKYDCSYDGCNKSFLRAANLKIHQRTHLGLKPFQCKWNGCDFNSERRENVIQHIRVSHFQLPRSVKEQKDRNIVDQRNANDYIEVITDQFDDPQTKALVAAMAASTGLAAKTAAAAAAVREGRTRVGNRAPRAPRSKNTEKPKPKHICHHPGCGKEFRRPANLKDHERIHLGLKPYQCAYGQCSFTSGRKENVIQHIRTNHFHLPRSMKEQKSKNIEDYRDPNDYIETVQELLN